VNFPKLKVLLADDNALNRELAETLLSEQGHQTVTVENGLLALEAVKAESFRRGPHGRPDADHGRHHRHPRHPRSQLGRAQLLTCRSSRSPPMRSRATGNAFSRRA
jgi:CheY-like chemotaxis protein